MINGTDTTAPTTQQAVEHPAWCYPAWCSLRITREGYVTGDHFRPIRTMPTCYGPDIHVLLSEEAAGRGEEMRVTVIVPLSEHFELPDVSNLPGGEDMDEHSLRIQMGHRLDLEPEEARMLARFLNQAADDHDKVTHR